MTTDEQRSELYKALMGWKRLDYYLTRFTSLDERGGGFYPSWNWAAFFLSWIWALYRKMYAVFFIVLGIVIIFNIFGFMVIFGFIAIPPSLGFLDGLVTVALMIGFGLYGNALYYRHTKKKIAKAQTTRPDAETLLSYIQSKGGVHVWAIWVFVIWVTAPFAMRAFVVEPFRIPSGAMLPTLVVGDHILVNKYVYGLRLPITQTKILDDNPPKRGDVIVFRFPGDTSINYIKRVVGLPGDEILYKDKRLYINGELISQRDPRPYTLAEAGHRVAGVQEFTEHLDRVEHGILTSDKPDFGALEFNVPDNHYFVLGDNRDRSNDSRFWGYVPEENLVGKAFIVLWNEGNNKRRWKRIE